MKQNDVGAVWLFGAVEGGDVMMQWGKARKFLNSICGRDDDAVALSRRDMLAGIGLALFVSAPKLLPPGAAEAKTIDVPAVEPAAGAADATNAAATEYGADERDAADSGDVTELSARRYWRRRYWHRHYWRRRYWRRRYWRRRYWRGRYWHRRRYWRRRYWRRYW